MSCRPSARAVVWCYTETWTLNIHRALPALKCIALDGTTKLHAVRLVMRTFVLIAQTAENDVHECNRQNENQATKLPTKERSCENPLNNPNHTPYLREQHIQLHIADPTITMIKLWSEWYGRSSALLLIKVCYSVKAVCHRGPCESAQSSVTPLGIHQRFLMGGMVSLELNLFWRAQCTGQALQPSSCTVHFDVWTAAATRWASHCHTCFMMELEVKFYGVQSKWESNTTPGNDKKQNKNPPSHIELIMF